jgi:hypothetical protein
MSVHKNNFPIFGLLAAFALVGTYNAVIINAETGIQGGAHSMKRLDELYGVTLPGRELAGSKAWTKLSSRELPVVKVVKEQINPITNDDKTIDDPAPAITADLVLPLTEALNPTRWPTPLPSSDFQGTISTSNGVIDNLTVSLPGVEEISVSFAELSGNVFQYDYEGMLYSGLMYQADQNAYIVTLTNGPLEGTRLRFSHSTQASNPAMSVGTFGEEQSVLNEKAPENPSETLQANGFDMGNQDVI